MARGHRLNTSIVLAAVHGLLGLPGLCARSSLNSLAPFPPPLSPSLISNLASVDVKQNGPGPKERYDDVVTNGQCVNEEPRSLRCVQAGVETDENVRRDRNAWTCTLAVCRQHSPSDATGRIPRYTGIIIPLMGQVGYPDTQASSSL